MVAVQDMDSIGSKPPLNLKHIKKYIKWKFENDVNYSSVLTKSDDADEKEGRNENILFPKLHNLHEITQSSQNFLNDIIQTPQNNVIETTQNAGDSGKRPWPLSPAMATGPLLSKVKTETNYVELNPYDMKSQNFQQKDLLLSTESVNSGKIMCKDFIRNKCMRGQACMFTHEIIYDQLKSIYKFCRDFENDRCRRPVCSFVHATIFEKECFYRTGYLPEHVFAHFKTNNIDKDPLDQSQIFFNSPKGSPQNKISEIFNITLGLIETTKYATAGKKRVWNDCNTPNNSQTNESFSQPCKKCKHCDDTEFRFQHYQAYLMEMLKGSQDLNENIDFLVKKNHRIYVLLQNILKPMKVDLDSLLSHFGDKAALLTKIYNQQHFEETGLLIDQKK